MTTDPLYSTHTIPGTDVELNITMEYAPIPVIQDPANPWLPKTDWGRDRIIAEQG